MNKSHFKIICISIILIVSCTSKKISYDEGKISKDTKLNFSFTENRGIKTNSGLIIYVEEDKKHITLYKGEKIVWRSNIIDSCGKYPFVGQAEIRYIRLDNNKVFVTFGRHSYADINMYDGKTTCLGSD